jgi:type I restriction enzyme, S subunit
MALDPGLYYPIDLDAIPPGWVAGVVGDFIDDVRPGFPSGAHNKLGEGIAHLRPMNVSRTGTIDLSVVKYVPAENGQRVQPGDVLFNNTNSPELVGKTAAIPDGVAAAYSNHMTRLRPPAGIDPKFVAMQLHHLWMTGYFLHRCVNYVNQASISSKALTETVPLVIPPTAEQRRIVAEIETQFTRLEAAVAALERARIKLNRYRAAALASAVDGPWPSARLGEVSEVQGGIQKQPKRVPAANAYPFLRVANVLRGRLNLGEIHSVELFPGELEKLRLQEGDLLVVEGNGSPAEIGRMAIWDGSIPNCVHQNHIIRVRLDRQLHPKFVEAYWNSPFGQRAVQTVASSTSGLYTLSVRKIAALTVPVPPLDEQDRIVHEVDRQMSVADEVKAALIANLKRAERMRQSILRKAFTGQLVAQDPNDQPESALLQELQSHRSVTSNRRSKNTSRNKKGQYALW